ncbi:PH domain-containing protein [Polaribacter sp. R77954]|uniref:PH domain-containing protein n=1 Tax=Polaribacter sp. R77954 TaxID=3093870 RepID=UPI0037C9D900
MEKQFQNDIVLELPDITKIEFNRIDKSYLKVISINFFLVLVSLLVGLIVLHQFLFTEEFNEFVMYIYSVFFLCFGCVFGFILFSFPLRKYALRDKDISYKRGLLIKKLTTVPFTRIQHVEIDEKPISRLFGLSSLSVYTAGDSSDDLEIKGLTKETALQIKEFISTKIDA